MSTPDSGLDEHLRALFGGLDTGADFDARLMTRLRAESHAGTAERAMRARQQEHARYRRAVLELQNWRRSMLRLLTLDTLGIALLLVLVLVTAGPRLGQRAVDIWRQYGPYLAMSFGMLIAVVPLVGMWADQTRRPVRLL